MKQSTEIIDTTVAQIRPLLANMPPAVQSAVLAELLATWLAGSVVRDNPERTRAVRDELLALHLLLVNDLVPLIAEELGTDAA